MLLGRISRILMMRAMTNLTFKMIELGELIKYYNYLNDNKLELFNSFHKLKNDRELKFSVLFDSVGDDTFDLIVSEIDKISLDLNQISDKVGELIKNGNLNPIKSYLEFYGESLDASIAYCEYLNKELENLINT